MTKQRPKKIHRSGARLAQQLLIWLAGSLEALLVARLVARLLAGRPDSPALMILYGVTGPLVAPLRALDYDQAPYGAALELSSLVLAICVPLVAYLAWALLSRRNRPSGADV